VEAEAQAALRVRVTDERADDRADNGDLSRRLVRVARRDLRRRRAGECRVDQNTARTPATESVTIRRAGLRVERATPGV
jgi:hypothetical protein